MDKRIIKMYNGSYCTFEGVNDVKEWTDGITKMLAEQGMGQLVPEDFVNITGAEVNRELGLTGSNRYPDDLVILGFSLKHITNTGALTMWKFQMGARWFDDIVANSLDREGKTWEELIAC